jgi:antitoxin VapB
MTRRSSKRDSGGSRTRQGHQRPGAAEPSAARARLFANGRSQAVRLPKAFRFVGAEVFIRRDGDAIILEPIPRQEWPDGYWAAVDRLADDLAMGRVAPIGAHLLDLESGDM